jgi:hypothetical protein
VIRKKLRQCGCLTAGLQTDGVGAVHDEASAGRAAHEQS